MAETERSLARIDSSDLLRLAALAAEAESGLSAVIPMVRAATPGDCCAGRCARERPCTTWTAATGSRTSTSGRSTRPAPTARFPTGGGARPTSAFPSSTAGPVTRRRRPDGGLTPSGGRCPRQSAPTRPPSYATTCQRRAPHRRRHWQPRQPSCSPRNTAPASASGPSKQDNPPELDGKPAPVRALGDGPENRLICVGAEA
jgi:hypothetical protein